MNPVAILRQPWAATLALGLCMWAQIPHSQHVFEHWAKEQSGWAFAWGFEAAVLMFVVRNMHGASWTFASLSALINVGYYGLQSVDMWAWPNEGNWLNWLLSLALPFTIAMYSHVLADVQEGAAWKLRIPAWAQLYITSALGAFAKFRGATTHTPNSAQVSAQALAEIVVQPAQLPDTQPIIIDSTLPAQLDEMNARIVASIGSGNYTPYAISKDTGIALTTLRRKSKDGDSYTGRIPQLCAQGAIRNSSGVDGTEYRLA